MATRQAVPTKAHIVADLPGVRPVSQKRSRDLVTRLLVSGLSLLRNRDFDGLTIDDLCADAGATVGSFYARFASKEAYLLALQHLVVEETRRRLVRDFSAEDVPPRELEPLVSWLCMGTVLWYRRYEGFIRASLRQTRVDPQAWKPVWALGMLKVDGALPLLARAAPCNLTNDIEIRWRLAFQMLHGTLNTMLLIDPGPKRLHDPDTPQMLAEVLTAQIRSALDAPVAAQARQVTTQTAASRRSGATARRRPG